MTTRDWPSMPTKQPSFLARTTLGPPNYLLVAMATLFMLAMAPLGAWKAIERRADRIETWLDPSHGVAADDRWFAEQFTGQQFVLVSWDDCTLGKPTKLASLTRKLDIAAAQDPTIARIETGPQWIDRLTTAPYSLSYEGALYRLEGTFVGPTQRDERGASMGHPSRLTCAAVFLNPTATANDSQAAAAIARIRSLAVECGVEPSALRMAGPAVDSVRVGHESLSSLLKWNLLAIALGTIVCVWRLRSLSLALLVTLPAMAGAAAMLAIIFYTGVLEVIGFGRSAPFLGVADALLMAAPMLTYGLTLVAGLRLIYYYRDARLAAGLEGAAESAVAAGWPAWGMTALLFAATMGAFCLSDLLPLRRFGLFSGLGSLASVGALLSILPIWLHRFPLSDRQVLALAGPQGNGMPSQRLRAIFEAAISGRGATALLGLIAVAAMFYGVQQLRTVTLLPTAVSKRSTLVSDYRWFGDRIGHAIPLELVITIPEERHRTDGEAPEADGQQYRMTLSEQLKLISEAEQQLAALPEVSGVISAATLQPAAGEVVQGMPETETLRRDLTRLQIVRDEVRTGGGMDTGRELWRLSCRVGAANPAEELDHLAIRQRVSDAISPLLKSYEQRDWLVRELHERGSELQGANVCVLFYGDSAAAAPNDGTPEATFAALLGRSGVQRGIVSYFNLAALQRNGESAADAHQRAAESLRYAQAVTLIAPPRVDEATLAKIQAGVESLVAAGVNVLDLTTLPSINESATLPLVNSGGPRPIRVAMTGTPMIAAAAGEELSATLNSAWKFALPVVIVAMMCIVWNPVVGLACAVAIVLPLAAALGTIGWFGVGVDLGVALVAGLALGVAFDAAVHYISWFRRGIEAGFFRQEAARMAFARCAPATVTGALAVGIGFSALALSPVTATHHLGLSALGMEIATLVTGLILLPAVLSSPLAGMLGAEKAPAAKTAETLAPVRIVLPGEGDGELRPSRTDVAAAGVPAPTQRGRSTIPAVESTEGPHAAIQAKLQRLRRATGE